MLLFIDTDNYCETRANFLRKRTKMPSKLITRHCKKQLVGDDSFSYKEYANVKLHNLSI